MFLHRDSKSINMVYEANEQLSSDDQKTLYSNKLLIEPNIFDEVYDDYEDWGVTNVNR